MAISPGQGAIAAGLWGGCALCGNGARGRIGQAWGARSFALSDPTRDVTTRRLYPCSLYPCWPYPLPQSAADGLTRRALSRSLALVARRVPPRVLARPTVRCGPLFRFRCFRCSRAPGWPAVPPLRFANRPCLPLWPLHSLLSWQFRRWPKALHRQPSARLRLARIRPKQSAVRRLRPAARIRLQPSGATVRE